jgi:hypothetical protein
MADLKISQLTGASTPLADTEVLPIVQSGATRKVSVADLTAGRAVAASSVTLGGGSSGGPMTVNGAIASVFIDSNGIQQVFTRAATNYISAPNGGFEYDGSVHTFKNQDQTVTFLTVASDTTLNSGNLVIGTAGKGIDFTQDPNPGGMTSELLDDYEEGAWTPNQGSGLTVVGAFSSAGTYTKVGRQVTINGSVAGATSIAGASGGAICTNLPFTVSNAISPTASAGSVGIANVNQGSTLIAFSTTIYLSSAITACAGINFTVTYFV